MTKKSCRKQRNNCYDRCYDPCVKICPPVVLTNIAVSGTGPFGPSVTIGFTVVNTATAPAANVSVSISANQVGVTPGAIAVTTGSTFNAPGTSSIFWNVGTLLSGQSASITFNQVGVGIAPNTWTAVSSTATPEITLVDNTATVFVPFPQ